MKVHSIKGIENVLRHFHLSEYGGHFGGDRIVAKVLQSGFYWPTLFKDDHNSVLHCDRCPRFGNIFKRHEMSPNNILEVKIFDVLGIDFMRPFISLFNNRYILVVVDYVWKWVEALALPINNAKVVMRFIKKSIFSRFNTPRAIVSDEGSHFAINILQHYLRSMEWHIR